MEHEDSGNEDEEMEEEIDLKKAMREMKDEMRELKDEIRERRDPRPRRRSRPRRSIHIDTDDWDSWGDHFGSTLERYIGGVLDSIGDTIDRSVGSIFQVSPSRRARKYRKLHPDFVPEAELDEFYLKGAAISGALADPTRLKMLKELEKKPLRQKDLAERSNTKGGNFKHHIMILMEEGLVRQEGVRERYLLTYAGREALKLVEFLYARAKRRIPIPITDSEESDEDSEDVGQSKDRKTPNLDSEKGTDLDFDNEVK